MLTKYLILGAVIAVAVIVLFRPGRIGAIGNRRSERPKMREGSGETVRCEKCGAYRLAGEACLCGHSSQD